MWSDVRVRTRHPSCLCACTRGHNFQFLTSDSDVLTSSPVTFGTSAAVPTKEDTLANLTTENSEGTPSTTYPVLVRATNGKTSDARKVGKKVKLATVVDSDALDAFYARYAEICKAGMLALKPRDRSKRKTKGKKKKGAAA